MWLTLKCFSNIGTGTFRTIGPYQIIMCEIKAFLCFDDSYPPTIASIWISRVKIRNISNNLSKIFFYHLLDLRLNSIVGGKFFKVKILNINMASVTIFWSIMNSNDRKFLEEVSFVRLRIFIINSCFLTQSN